MTRRTYHPLARWLHWSIFALVLVGLPIGLVMVRRDFDALNNVLYTLHWSIGLTVLFLMTIRIVTRLTVATPRPASVLSPAQRFLSQSVHLALYVMLVAAPVLGWLGKSAYGASAQGINVFYLFHVPVLLEKDEELAETLFFYHGVAVRIFLALLALHVAGALYHWFVAKDGVIGRMGIGRRVAEPES